MRFQPQKKICIHQIESNKNISKSAMADWPLLYKVFRGTIWHKIAKTVLKINIYTIKKPCQISYLLNKLLWSQYLIPILDQISSNPYDYISTALFLKQLLITAVCAVKAESLPLIL